MSAPNSSSRPTPERLMQLAWGYAPPLIIEAALRHRVFDVLDQKPQTADEVSAATGASARGLRIIMNALVGLNFLAKDEQQRYSLTPESELFLVSTKPSFYGGLIRHTSVQLISRWTQLSETVRTGMPSVMVDEQDDGAHFFREFVADIFPLSFPAARALAQELKIAEAAAPLHVLDLAAGSGVWGIALAQASPQVRVRAVDWSGVLPITQQMAGRFGVAAQMEYVAGDMRQVDFGTGHQVATLGHILHSEGDTRSRTLLKRTFDALAPGGTIAIADFLVNDERTGPPMALIFAVNMLVNCAQGDTFSYNEIAGWLTEAGFTNPRTLDAPGPSPLILATKP